MASLGEIVPVELPNPEDTQIQKGENEPVLSCLLLSLCSFYYCYLYLTNTVDATVTV